MQNLTNQQKSKSFFIDSFSSYLTKVNGKSSNYLTDFKNEALNTFRTLEFPDAKNEEWKYTSLLPLLNKDFQPATDEDKTDVSENLLKEISPEIDSYRMVFVNGFFNSALSDIAGLPQGIEITTISEAVNSENIKVKEYLSKSANSDNAFFSLNNLFFTDGVFLDVSKGKLLDKPLYIYYITDTDKNLMVSPRNLFLMSENSEAKVIMHFYGKNETSYFMNPVTDVFSEKGSYFQLYKIQEESDKAYHIDNTEFDQNENVHNRHYYIGLGGLLTRNEFNYQLLGEYTTGDLYGIYLGTDENHTDNHTFMNHAVANCESNELYKGILSDKSRGVFNGKILVQQDAQKTNAYQSNKTVLLSNTARIDSKPQLEIYADDVKCSHGATVGQLDKNSLFYIISRGVPEELAKSMLIRAFASDVIEFFKIDELKDFTNKKIFEYLKRIKI